MIVTAEVMRELVSVSVNFEVKDHGWIEYTNVTDISNMLTRQEIHAHYAQDDPRIPPLVEYVEEDHATTIQESQFASTSKITLRP
jgi:hypothetical protein